MTIFINACNLAPISSSNFTNNSVYLLILRLCMTNHYVIVHEQKNPVLQASRKSSQQLYIKGQLRNTCCISEVFTEGRVQRKTEKKMQTWKKARTRGHCPRKFLRIVDISGLWKIDYSYFGIKIINCENFFLNIKYLAYLQPMNQ